jgi:hypothetical protein
MKYTIRTKQRLSDSQIHKIKSIVGDAPNTDKNTNKYNELLSELQSARREHYLTLQKFQTKFSNLEKMVKDQYLHDQIVRVLSMIARESK